MPSEMRGGLEYSRIGEIRGPLLIVEGITKVAFDELVEVESPDGGRRLGKVLEVGEGRAVVEVFEGTSGISIVGTRARFLGRTMEIPVSSDLLGRIFDGIGRPVDGLAEPLSEDF
ncbi:MAG: V-type ATP synthase subunit B, partial [Candidatus Methylarchaceae archaeon HK01B]|nr:V-type ATP synthase subunit B [Candidatus Methylarchaceae archaeon HK01B]